MPIIHCNLALKFFFNFLYYFISHFLFERTLFRAGGQEIQIRKREQRLCPYLRRLVNKKQLKFSSKYMKEKEGPHKNIHRTTFELNELQDARKTGLGSGFEIDFVGQKMDIKLVPKKQKNDKNSKKLLFS